MRLRIIRLYGIVQVNGVEKVIARADRVAARPYPPGTWTGYAFDGLGAWDVTRDMTYRDAKEYVRGIGDGTVRFVLRDLDAPPLPRSFIVRSRDIASPAAPPRLP